MVNKMIKHEIEIDRENGTLHADDGTVLINCMTLESYSLKLNLRIK